MKMTDTTASSSKRSTKKIKKSSTKKKSKIIDDSVDMEPDFQISGNETIGATAL